jgi:putative membrane protein
MTSHDQGTTPSPMDPRVGLAAERTLLAWVRTGLALMGFGFVVARFGLFLREIAAARLAPPEPSPGLSLWIGSGLVVLGVVVNVAAAVQHVRLLRRLERGEPYRPSAWSLGIAVTLLLACLGVVMTAYLFLGSH